MTPQSWKSWRTKPKSWAGLNWPSNSTSGAKQMPDVLTRQGSIGRFSRSPWSMQRTHSTFASRSGRTLPISKWLQPSASRFYSVLTASRPPTRDATQPSWRMARTGIGTATKRTVNDFTVVGWPWPISASSRAAIRTQRTLYDRAIKQDDRDEWSCLQQSCLVDGPQGQQSERRLLGTSTTQSHSSPISPTFLTPEALSI